MADIFDFSLTAPAWQETALPLLTPTPEPAWTWARLVDAEPLLERLAAHILIHRLPPGDPLHWRQWASIKRELQTLVGWSAANPTLRSEAAYGAAYDLLLTLWECPREGSR